MEPVQPPDHDDQEFGARLRELRVDAGLSQRALAELAGVSHSAVAGLEVGRSAPSLHIARKLAGALGVSLDDLAGGEA